MFNKGINFHMPVIKVKTQPSRTRERRQQNRDNLYHVPELCLINPLPLTLFLQACSLPATIYRLNMFFFCVQLRNLVSLNAKIGLSEIPRNHKRQLFPPDSDSEKQPVTSSTLAMEFGGLCKDRKDFDSQKSFINKDYDKCPDISNTAEPDLITLSEALTLKGAGDFINLENLETLGDSFLKYAVTVHLYCTEEKHEGILTEKRRRQIQNKNLFRCAKNIKLNNYLRCHPFEGRGNNLPPLFVLKETFNEESLRSEQVIGDKSLADSIEALIGAYLLKCGPEGALRFMAWIGLKVVPNEFELNSDHFKFFTVPKLPLFPQCDLNQIQNKFEAMEKILGYKFKNKVYLSQALTHASAFNSAIPISYERLEFLGDAILDYLITRFIYSSPYKLTPGQITDLRCAMVNNTYFASLVVHYGFYKYFNYTDRTLMNIIDSFVDKTCGTREDSILIEEEEALEIEEVEVPKVLGDIFESVAGAIYLDSGMSLDTVWRVYYRLMAPELDHYMKNVPKMPVRLLMEKYPLMVTFEKIEKKGNGQKVYMRVKIDGVGCFEGCGRNKKKAKLAAAKHAVNIVDGQKPRK